VAVGVGGYASGPVLRVAAKRGVPTVLQEQNSYAGKTNRWLSRRAKRICVAYDNMDRYFPKKKLVYTGNPVRQSLAESSVTQPEALRAFGLSADRKTLLVLGGSLGARTINESVRDGVNAILDAGYQILWQCGRAYLEGLESLARGHVCIKAFIERMDHAYAAADVIVARAGALTISELCLVGKPAILVPSPNVAEDHQRKNAGALVEKDAAEMILDVDARARLVDAAVKLLGDSVRCEALSQHIRHLAKPQAAEHIAREVIAVIQESAQSEPSTREVVS
jgi:UDP-N-acetylglucosamine--N-acetylmuramyl-(pentapeptide) pyrophosphoryl-undecaprenol N-acetylglucosamine transferase